MRTTTIELVRTSHDGAGDPRVVVLKVETREGNALITRNYRVAYIVNQESAATAEKALRNGLETVALLDAITNIAQDRKGGDGA